MKRLMGVIHAFSKGIARSRVSLIGAMIVTLSAPFLFGAILYDAFLHIDNTYFSAAVYMLLGPAFIFGLILVFFGLFFFKGKEEVSLFTLEYLREYFTDPEKFSRMRKLIFFAVFLTGINVLIVSMLGYRTYHYMESVAFCGKFCHTVMKPEYTAYQNSPHSRVACATCHIGAGADWFVKSKISGARQLVAVAFESYSRPIETPVHGLRPARDTCEECHRPEMFHGDKLVIIDKFLSDEANTQVKTVLLMKVGSAGDRTIGSHGIHWHVAPENKIFYRASDRSRMVLPEVALTGRDGKEISYRTAAAGAVMKSAGEEGERREMDCIDCHNRPTHIYQPPGAAIDRKILSGEIDRSLPFIKKNAMRIITGDYVSLEQAKSAVATELTEFYRKNFAGIIEKKGAALQKSIAGIQAAYAENVFPEMNVKWGTYTNHLGHNADAGCFRCHDESHETASGKVISMDCDTCHTILAEEEENPEILKALSGM